jgi:hypothetical protein
MVPIPPTSLYSASLCLGVQVQMKLAAQKHEEQLAEGQSELHQTRSALTEAYATAYQRGAAPLRTGSQDRSASRPEKAPTGGLRDKTRGAYLERYVSSASPAEQVLAAEKTGAGSWRLS